MKTDSLIEALVSDTVTERGVIRTGAILLPTSLVLLGTAFAATLGMRANISAPQIAATVAMKLAITTPLAGACLFLACRQARANSHARSAALMLAIAPMILAVVLAMDLQQHGLDGWQSRLVGSNGWRCIVTIPLLSTLPLAAILAMLRQGTVTRHIVTGAIAGVAAAGIGASFYALNCTDDSPLFIAAWYGLATAIVAGIGAAACRLLVRW